MSVRDLAKFDHPSHAVNLNANANTCRQRNVGGDSTGPKTPPSARNEGEDKIVLVREKNEDSSGGIGMKNRPMGRSVAK